MNDNKNILGWGRVDNSGSEIWDDNPIFKNDKVEFSDRLKLLFYPKKFLLYRFIAKAKRKYKSETKKPFRILDVGCGTGSAVIDLKKMFGRNVEVVGIDVVKMQVELGIEKIKKNAVWAELEWYDGENIPYPMEYFDAIYTSDVLGHVENVPKWLDELNRVLKKGGVLAMFSESALGKNAYVRKYLFNRGLNTDPYAEFHISLYSKAKLKEMIENSGFNIEKMFNSFWLSFFVHPEDFYEKLQAQNKFFVLRKINKFLCFLKNKTKPYSTAIAEFYGLIEILTIGRWLEAQGYIILAKKK
jgi:ubiquinone/menaquinone biosynthesis C-methylase UbiE